MSGIQIELAGQVDLPTGVEAHGMGGSRTRVGTTDGQVDISTRVEVCVMGDPRCV